jgi:hypothetical protein
MRRIRRQPPLYMVREQLTSDRASLRLAPIYFGPGSRRECERRRDQLNAEPLPNGFTARDVSLHRLFSLFGGLPAFRRGGVVPGPSLAVAKDGEQIKRSDRGDG